MKDIYQKIWNADQNENGIEPLLDTEQGNQEKGFIKVNTNLDSTNEDLRIFTQLHIPEPKMKTYRLGLKLFDNFALRERDEEMDTPEERTEVHDFVEAIIDTAPMQVAREYVAQQTGSSLSRQRWYNTLMEMWFRKFSMGGDPHLTGFEHVIVGEQEGAKAQGYHFWYKYYLDDGFATEQDGIFKDSFPALTDDRIKYFGTKATGNQSMYPESVTISYRWFAPDYERQSLRPLFKKIGGFFVGCSIEGLLALGTVRGHLGINAPRKATINGAEYDMRLFHSHDKRHIRTFYPKFLRGVTVPPDPDTTPIPIEPIIAPTVKSPIKIIAALVNPEGHDPGKESITLINVNAEKISLSNWKIMDKNGNSSSFSIPELGAGETYRLILDGRGAQLSNSKNGTIKLLNHKGEMAHLVSYSKNTVQEQGQTILF